MVHAHNKTVSMIPFQVQTSIWHGVPPAQVRTQIAVCLVQRLFASHKADIIWISAIMTCSDHLHEVSHLVISAYILSQSKEQLKGSQGKEGTSCC